MKTINQISISGGKDSTALWLLAIERGVPNIRAVFADTGHEHAQTYEYLDYLESKLGPITRVKADFSRQMKGKAEFIAKKWVDDGVTPERAEAAIKALVPTGNPFLDMVKWKGRFPSSQARFCTDQLKVLPMMEQFTMPLLKEGYKIVSWQGVRADESPSRAKLPESDVDDLGVTNYRPILSWTVEDVFAMHDKHGIKPNPLYKQGMSRVGCMPCIHSRKAELAEIAKRFPDEIDRVERWEKEASITSKWGSATLRCITDLDANAPEDANYKTHGIRRAVQWAQTARGGRQADWVSQLDAPTCSSNYGLCE